MPEFVTPLVEKITGNVLDSEAAKELSSLIKTTVPATQKQKTAKPDATSTTQTCIHCEGAKEFRSSVMVDAEVPVTCNKCNDDGKYGVPCNPEKYKDCTKPEDQKECTNLLCPNCKDSGVPGIHHFTVCTKCDGKKIFMQIKKVRSIQTFPCKVCDGTGKIEKKGFNNPRLTLMKK